MTLGFERFEDHAASQRPGTVTQHFEDRLNPSGGDSSEGGPVRVRHSIPVRESPRPRTKSRRA